MSKEQLLRRIGLRSEGERWWEAFDALWGLVGCTESIRHNLMVLALAESHDAKRAAAFEVAAAIMATSVALRGGGGW